MMSIEQFFSAAEFSVPRRLMQRSTAPISRAFIALLIHATDKKEWMDAMERMADLWCRFMHDDPKWPSHGWYECRACGRRYPVWESSPATRGVMVLPRETRASNALVAQPN